MLRPELISFQGAKEMGMEVRNQSRSRPYKKNEASSWNRKKQFMISLKENILTLGE